MTEQIKKVVLDSEKVLSSFNKNIDKIEARYKDGVEKYRKGNFTIKFLSSGQKTISIKQIKHKFLFGCNAFMLDSFESSDKEVLYKQKFAKIFNHAVVPFYWKDLEPQEDELRFKKDSVKMYRRPAPDVVLDFCKEYDLQPKGHCLTWNWFTPDWLEKYNVDERKRLLEKRFKEISDEYADKIPSFDIVNESASNYNIGKKTLFDGYDEYSLKLGGKYFANNKKILNEWNYAIWDTYVTSGKYMPFNMQLKDFIQKGYPIDEIGLQFHMFTPAEKLDNDSFDVFLNVENHLDVLDVFNAYNLPMHISEITIPCYPYCLSQNEEIQAKLTEYFYKIWFSTPNMKSIVWWNLVDGYAAYAPRNSYEGENYYAGGLLKYDMAEKSSYKVLDNLINNEWKTNINDTTNKNELSFKGFYGEYEITVTVGNKQQVKTVKFYDDNAVLEI